MVAGLLRPEVYCGEDVHALLSHREQRAVLLHERCHQRRRDPVRLVLLDAVDQTLGWLPMVRRWTIDQRARIEIRADQHALRGGATRQEIAAALLRLGSSGLAPGAGFAGVTQRRLEALLADESPISHRSSMRTLVLSAMVSAALLAGCAPISDAAHPELHFLSSCQHESCSSGT